MILRSLKTAALAAVIGTSLSARADTCPTPTVSQCADPTYRASSCFATHSSYCGTALETGYRSEVNAKPQEYRLLPENLGGQVRRVGVLGNYTPYASDHRGYSNHIAGLISMNQIVHRKGFLNLSPSEELHAAGLDRWASNGTVAESCQEYVHEKYLDYSRFEARLGEVDGDARKAFERAISKDGIAFRTLYGIDERPLEPIFDGKQPLAKNPYFRFTPGPYPSGFQGYPFTSSAAKRANNPEARSWYVASDDWHLKMNQELSKENDDVLDERRGKARQFEELLARRSAVWSSYQKLVKQTQDPKQLGKTVTQQLLGLDAALEQALIQGEKEGCLELDSNACDWSPRLYGDLVGEVMGQRRQKDLSRCLELTANDFSKESFIRNAQLIKLPGLEGSDYTLSPGLIDTFLEAYRAYLDGLDTPVDPSTGLTRRSGGHSDSDERGDRSYFAGGISYGADWEATWGSRFCDAEIRVGGHASASAWVFGTGGELVHVEGFVETQDENIHLVARGRVLGNDLPGALDRTFPAVLDLDLVTIPLLDESLEYTQTFMVWVIPVTVGAGINVELGINVGFGGGIVRDCSRDRVGLNVSGSFEPFVQLDTFVSVAIGFPGFRFGLRGEVTVARVEAPLEATIGINLDPSLELRLNAEIVFSLGQRYLDGSISLFGEVGPCPVCIRGSADLVSWTGFGGTAELLNESIDVPLARL